MQYALEALELLRQNPGFDLVITDVIMPHMSGKELCELIKRERSHTRVLLMSGYTDDALAHHGVLDEGLSFLEKPFSPSGLARKVRDRYPELPLLLTTGYSEQVTGTHGFQVLQKPYQLTSLESCVEKVMKQGVDTK